MALQVLMNEPEATGKITTEARNGVKQGILTMVLSSPADRNNIFDIDFHLEISEDGQRWTPKHRMQVFRGIDDDGEPVNSSMIGQSWNVEAPFIRCIADCGQGNLSAIAFLAEEQLEL